MGSASDSSNTPQSCTLSTSTCTPSDSPVILGRCPVCFELAFLPVVLPCRHEVCKACFDHCVESGLLTCPVCRHRFSSWARRSKGKVVSEDRVRAIGEAGPSNLLQQSLYVDDEVVRSTYKPGELHQEYIQELQRIVQEDLEREMLDRDSALKLEQQDRQEMMSMTHQAERDREIAEMLSKELNGENCTTSLSQTSGKSSGSQTPGTTPGSQTPGRTPGSQTPDRTPGSQTPGRTPGSQTPGTTPGSQTSVSTKGIRTHVSPTTPSRVKGPSAPKVLQKKGTTSKGSASKNTHKKKKNQNLSKDAATLLSGKENSPLSQPNQTKLHFLFSKEAERLKDEDYRLALSIREELRQVSSQQQKDLNSGGPANKSCGVLKYFHSNKLKDRN